VAQEPSHQGRPDAECPAVARRSGPTQAAAGHVGATEERLSACRQSISPISREPGRVYPPSPPFSTKGGPPSGRPTIAWPKRPGWA
jgi:hypothetical protein